MVDRFCSYTRHLKCSTTNPSARLCECRNAGRQCTGCYCWGNCKDKGWFMLSPTTTRGLLIHIPRGADPPANDRRATTPPPVRSPKSLSLRAISAAGAGGRSTWRGGGKRPQGHEGDGGRGRRGGQKRGMEWRERVKRREIGRGDRGG